MPYARNQDLPTSVKNPLPVAAQTLFRRVVNAQLQGGKSEEVAFRSAWSAVSQQYKKPAGGTRWVHKVRNATLYGRRNVENAVDIIKWAKSQGFEKTVQPHDMHVTVAHSSDAVDWPAQDDDAIVIKSQRGRVVEPLGDEGAVVLKFASPSLDRRFNELCKVHGCSWDYPDYSPHVSISYDAGSMDLSKVEPYTGPIELGPEIFEEVDDADWADSITEKGAAEPTLGIFKFLKSLGLVFGWAIVSKVGGEEYYDLQGDHIPEDAMLEAATKFMEEHRVMKVMHKGKQAGEVVFAWPMTTEIAKAMGLKSGTTGLMVGVKPTDKKVLKDFEDGTLTGFSIGGHRLVDEEVE